MRRTVSRWWVVAVALSMMAALSGCSFSGSATGTGTGTGAGSVTGTATATGAGTTSTAATNTPGSSAAPTATPIPAPPHAFAWYQYDSHKVPQIWASLNGGTPFQITHVAPDGAACSDQIAWSPPVFSPNLTHIIASMGSFNCGDGNMTGPVSVITVSGGSVSTLAPSYQMPTTVRAAGWLDNSTAWFVTYNGFYTFTLGGSPSQVPGPANITDAVVRGSILYWQTSSYSTTVIGYSIHRYDLGSHTALSGTVSQGQVGTCSCSPGDAHGPGWDVSRDGTHIVYQVTTPTISPSGGVASAKIYYANSDGSGAVQIAHALVTNATARMQFSPNGQWVAFTEATPAPSTLTASVNSSGGSGDPTFHGYSPDTFNYPVWKWDNSQFWAGNESASSYYYGEPVTSTTPAPALERFNLGGSGTIGVPGGLNPWYTIGG